MTRIHVLSGLNAGASVDTDEPVVTIGSDAEQCALVLLDAAVAPRHLAVHCEPGSPPELRPLDSGVVVVENHGPLEGPMPLTGPTCVRIGHTDLLIRPDSFDDPAGAESASWDMDASSTGDAAKTARAPGALIACAAIGCAAVLWALVSLISTPATADPRRAESPQRGSTLRSPPPSPPSLTHDRGLEAAPPLRTHDRGGSVLLESAVAAPPADVLPATAAPLPTRHTFARLTDGPSGPYLETKQGDRYPLAASEDEGYAIRWASDEEIHLRRNGQSIVVKIE